MMPDYTQAYYQAYTQVPSHPLYHQPLSPPTIINTQPIISSPKATNIDSSEKIRLSFATSCIALGALGIIGGASIGSPVIFGAGLLLTIISIAATLPSGVHVVYHPFFHRNHHWQWSPHWQWELRHHPHPRRNRG